MLNVILYIRILLNIFLHQNFDLRLKIYLKKFSLYKLFHIITFEIRIIFVLNYYFKFFINKNILF
jgi:hypothetical protein